jgi:hypothetical protein
LWRGRFEFPTHGIKTKEALVELERAFANLGEKPAAVMLLASHTPSSA